MTMKEKKQIEAYEEKLWGKLVKCEKELGVDDEYAALARARWSTVDDILQMFGIGRYDNSL